MAQQTAVEWLQSKVLYIVPSSQKDDLLKLFEQAKEMDKEQHFTTFEAGNKRGWSGYPNTDNWTQPTFEQYYKETYGGGESNDTMEQTKPVLWEGWISTEKELPSDEMDGQQILMCLTYQKSEPLVLCGVWKDGKFHCLDTDDVFDNVGHWACLPPHR